MYLVVLFVPKEVFIEVVAERGDRKEEEDVAVRGLRGGNLSVYINGKSADSTY